MARQYVVNSWVGAAEYPEGDQYSGEQIGHRNKPSIGVQIERSGDQWRTVSVDQHFTGNGAANIKAYTEPTQPTPKGKPPAKKKTAYETIALADNHYERLCNLSEALDLQLENGELEFTDYAYARKNLDKRIDKAWLRVCKDRQWNENGDDSLGTQQTTPSEAWESGEWCVENTQTPAKAHKPHKHVSFDIIPKESVFFNLADDNTLKLLFVKVLTCWLAASKVVSTATNTSKEILTEGLI